MKPRPASSPAIPVRCGPNLSFESTCAVIERMDNPVRQRVGALEIISGLVDGDDDRTERVVLCVDPATGASYVSQWVQA